MLFYIIYIFIISSLVKYLNINIIISIINTIFYYSNNSIFLYAITAGISLKILFKNKLKKDRIIKIIPFIIIDLIKIFFIKYNAIFILISILISILLINNKLKINKYILLIIYIIFPITGYIVYFKNNTINNNTLITIPLLIFILVNSIPNILTLSIRSTCTFIVLAFISYMLYNHKKRNITLIFLLFIYLFYYFILL